jgi:hypothetical protein
MQNTLVSSLENERKFIKVKYQRWLHKDLIFYIKAFHQINDGTRAILCQEFYSFDSSDYIHKSGAYISMTQISLLFCSNEQQPYLGPEPGS